jgi:hypothetical protein
VVGAADLGDVVTRALCAAVALIAAAFLVAVAIDVGRWQRAGGRTPATLAGGVAGELLGTHDDVALRSAVRSFRAAERVPVGFDDGRRRSRARAEAEGRLSDVAATAAPWAASQAYDLLGVLAWGGARAPAGVLDPADQAVQAFTAAARLDPANADAAFNLEIAVRALRGAGVRRGASPGSGTTGLGRSGAGAGAAGTGY